MIVDCSSPLHLKRRRLTTVDVMEAEAAKAKFAAVKEKFGHDLHVFETSVVSSSLPQASNDEDTDDFYEFTTEDYYRLLPTKKGDKYLKTKKIREAEEAAHRSRITKTAIRIRFPDNHTLEVVFHPSEKIQSLFDLLSRVLAQPVVPFYLYTTPPKKQIKDLSQDFYSAGLIPGAIVYFSYDKPNGEDNAAFSSGPFLQEDVMSLKGLDVVPEPAEPVHTALEPVRTAPPPVPQEPKAAGKKPVKPKWLKM
ncbi:plant UBX domain-containing protein 1-like [Populus alba x Populus x berolinensis]|nr:plant UBX domain-containing protein 1-like [Populus alba x Populus x berolinensis]